jgi:hypothetical protein
MTDKRLIEDRIDDYLLDEGILKKAAGYTLGRIARGLEISFDEISRHISDELERSASRTSLDKISKMKYRDESGELRPNVKRQLKALYKKLEYYKGEFIKVLTKIEELTE